MMLKQQGPLLQLDEVLALIRRYREKTTNEQVVIDCDKYLTPYVMAMPRYFTADGTELCKERDEAVQLLTKVCELVKDTSNGGPPIGVCLNFLNQIDGLPKWWEKHRPLTDREAKINKIASALSLDGNPNDDFRKVAERVLQALGE